MESIKFEMSNVSEEEDNTEEEDDDNSMPQWMKEAAAAEMSDSLEEGSFNITSCDESHYHGISCDESHMNNSYESHHSYDSGISFMGGGDADSTYGSCGDSALTTSGEEDETKDNSDKKLSVPFLDWDKLNEDKNRNNRLLSNQRRQITKDKQKDQKGRTRKITPSHAPEISPLKQLSALKKMNEWAEIMEEAEEEEEEG